MKRVEQIRKRTFIDGVDEDGEHWGDVIEDVSLPCSVDGKVIQFDGWNDYDTVSMSPAEFFEMQKRVFAMLLGHTVGEVEAVVEINRLKAQLSRPDPVRKELDRRERERAWRSTTLVTRRKGDSLP